MHACCGVPYRKTVLFRRCSMALEGKKLTLRYDRAEWIFRDIDITVEQGAVFGITGDSGCGKTSLARVLAYHLKPDEGEILIDGKSAEQICVGGKHPFWPVQLIFQHPEKAVNPKWKLDKILTESYEPAPDILERFGIKREWFTRFPIELSGGELQRCLIVRALHPELRYLIADEMTTMLDAVTQALIWKELMAVIKERKIGLIIISHEKAIIEKLCTDTLYMERL